MHGEPFVTRAFPPNFDRLSRSLPELITMLNDLKATLVKFRPSTEYIDTTDL